MRRRSVGFAFVVDLRDAAHSRPLSVRPGGVIIDVDFKEATRAAVRYLNQRGFRIDLIRLRARVPNRSATSDDRWMRLDFEEIIP